MSQPTAQAGSKKDDDEGVGGGIKGRQMKINVEEVVGRQDDGDVPFTS